MNRPLTVLYVHHGSGRGGAPLCLARMLRHLDRNQVNPIVSCDYRERDAVSFFGSHGFPPIDLPVARFSHVASWWPLHHPRGAAKAIHWLVSEHPRAQRAFAALLARVRPDLVHLNSVTLAPLSPTAARQGVPLVLHVREPVAQGSLGARRRWLKCLATQYASHIIYICSDNQARLTGPVPTASVLYDALPLDRFRDAAAATDARAAVGVPTSPRVILFPGGSSFSKKGIVPFLQSLSDLRRAGRNVLAIVPGLDAPAPSGNPERKRIDSLIASLHLDDVVLRLPFALEVERYYAAADIVAAPFVTPHFSMAVLEAGAASKPVVGSRLGGIREVLSDGVNGMLVPPCDVTALTRAFLALIDNAALRHAQGSEGRRQAVARCDPETYTKRLMTIYRRVATQACPSRSTPMSEAGT